mmetsp:Transcript_3054/g.9432  ORF Transcript_3054/g.9432 Transcript_3054/m.9432 type:complete len:221 (-) Transcript_3054:1261-1923(-)
MHSLHDVIRYRPISTNQLFVSLGENKPTRYFERYCMTLFLSLTLIPNFFPSWPFIREASSLIVGKCSSHFSGSTSLCLRWMVAKNARTFASSSLIFFASFSSSSFSPCSVIIPSFFFFFFRKSSSSSSSSSSSESSSSFRADDDVVDVLSVVDAALIASSILSFTSSESFLNCSSSFSIFALFLAFSPVCSSMYLSAKDSSSRKLSSFVHCSIFRAFSET